MSDDDRARHRPWPLHVAEALVFEWLRRKRTTSVTAATGFVDVPGQESVGVDQARFDELASSAQPMSGPSLLGRWVELQLPWEHDVAFVGFVYVDETAGLSAKGDRIDSPSLAHAPTYTVRLPMTLPWRVLDDEEARRLALPARPAWLEHFGPQPDPDAPWRNDPIMRAHSHESFVDDVQVIVHDGEPRRTSRRPEQCWVRVLGAELRPSRVVVYSPEAAKMDAAAFEAKYLGLRYVYRGRLLNQPHHLTTIKAGDDILFVSAVGLDEPLLVTPQYLHEQARWRWQPCNRCGLVETLDPPSVMAKTRFPDTPADETVRSFTSFCAKCGDEGMQMLSLAVDEAGPLS